MKTLTSSEGRPRTTGLGCNSRRPTGAGSSDPVGVFCPGLPGGDAENMPPPAHPFPIRDKSLAARMRGGFERTGLVAQLVRARA
jgi:hypothetical protein